MKNSLIKTLLILVVVAAMNGCATSGTATTQPSLPILVTQAETSVDIAVKLITLGVQTKIISDAEYWSNVNPFVVAAQTATSTMQADVNAGNTSGAEVAANAALAALANIQPYLTKVQASTQPTTKAS